MCCDKISYMIVLLFAHINSLKGAERTMWPAARISTFANCSLARVMKPACTQSNHFQSEHQSMHNINQQCSLSAVACDASRSTELRIV